MKEPVLAHLEVPRSARYALLGEPGQGVRSLWIVLHGYRQLASRFIRRFRGIATPERLVVAPEALNRFYVGDPPGRHGPDSRVGGTWMTREDRDTEITDYVRYLDLLHDHLQESLPAPVPVVALGFSQGCHTVSRWAAHGRTRPAAVVLWGEVLPADLSAGGVGPGLLGSRLISVQGREDGFINPVRLAEEEERARSLGLRVERRWHTLGHVVEPEALAGLARDLDGVSPGGGA